MKNQEYNLNIRNEKKKYREFKKSKSKSYIIK